MKQIILTLTVIFLATSMFGQKAKFKSKVCSVQKVNLPLHNTDPDKRTYKLTTKGKYSSYVEEETGRLYGWTATEENPDVKAVVSLYGYRIGSAKKESKKREKKDKDGKVTDSWTEYKYTNTATGMGTIYVYGPDNKFTYTSKRKKSKQKKEEPKKEESKANDNPFLSQATADEAEESDIGEDSGLEETELSLLGKYSVNQEKTIETKYYRKSADAYKAYKAEYDGLSAYRYDYPQDAYKSAVSRINNLYGYKPLLKRFYLKRMKSEKHPEYKTWNNAVDAAITIFKTVKYNKPIEGKQEEFNPIVDYFSNQLTSSSASDKKAKKLRKAALGNLLQILEALDRHDEVIEWSNKYMDDKKLDQIAKRNMNTSGKVKAHLAFLNMPNRHINNDEEISDDNLEQGELAEDDEEDN